MDIHVVLPGDTINSIADRYGVSAERLILDNGVTATGELVPGQTIVVIYPQKTYTVKEGDSLSSIAASQEITLIQLLRNNPFLSDREYIFPGEILVISYDQNRGKRKTNGFANVFIDQGILKKTLPFLTYLTIFGYRTTENGEIVGIEDGEVINLAREYHVAPIMMLSTLTLQGKSSYDIALKILIDDQLINRHIESIISILQRKGFYGVNLTYQFFSEETRQLYEKYTEQLANRLHQEGFPLFITLSENFIIKDDRLTFDQYDYSGIIQKVDGVTLLNYNWGYSFGPPIPVVSTLLMKEYFDYLVTQIPPQKIEAGIPIIGYDWELPYIIGVTRATSLTLDSAVILAKFTGASIQFDEVSQTPYFTYIEERSGIPYMHMVRFLDARSMDAILKLSDGYGFRGTGVWNIMNYYSQIWLILNSQYEIETIMP